MKIKGNHKILLFHSEIQKLMKQEFCKPRMAIFYPTYSCQLRCRDCLYISDLGTKHFPSHKINYLLDQLSLNGVKAIELCGGGEPLLYPDIEMLLDACFEKDLQVGIITNGIAIAKLVDRLNQCEYVRVSLPGVSRESYSEITGVSGSVLDKVLQNVDVLIKTRNKIGSKTKVGLKMTLGTDNIIDIEKLLKKSLKLGVDYCQIKMLRSSGKELTDLDIKNLKKEVKGLRDKYKISENFLLVEYEKSTINSRCWLSPLHTMVDYNGDIYLCCYFQYRKEEMKIGNILQKNFADIWGSSEHVKKYNNTNINLCNKYDCRFHGYHKLVDNIYNSKEIDTNFI